jgi:8-oxo-dGTP pyrophosphatase MutT (NUDIX family)
VDPAVEAERGERVALGHAGERGQSVPLGVCTEELEVDSRGDVGRAWPVEEILDRAVCAIAVGWAARLAHPAVVDQERVARVGEPGGDLFDGCERGLGEHCLLPVAELDIAARGRVAELLHEPIPVEPDQDLLRPGRRAAEPPEREIVQELVGEDQLRGCFQMLRDVDPFDRGERPASARTRLDGVVDDVQRLKVIHELSCERAVARAELRHGEGARLAQPAVQVGDRAPEQLGEHGMDVGARDEVSVRTDRRIFEEPSGPEERELHVLGERDRAVIPDRARDGVAHIHERQRTGSWVASDPVSEEIRQAASMIGVRDGSDGPEVLVIERTLDHRFLPGYIAFPGGAVDPADGPLAERWFGHAEEASRAAAVRELVEEVGLAVTREKILGVDRDRPLARIDEAPPPVSLLPEVARWVAPERVPVRFDARYFAARMDGATDPAPDGVEAARAWWALPRDLMRAWESEDLLLYWPTHFTMKALADCRDADEVLGLRISTREPDDDELGLLPRSVFYQD